MMTKKQVSDTIGRGIMATIRNMKKNTGKNIRKKMTIN